MAKSTVNHQIGFDSWEAKDFFWKKKKGKIFSCTDSVSKNFLENRYKAQNLQHIVIQKRLGGGAGN